MTIWLTCAGAPSESEGSCTDSHGVSSGSVWHMFVIMSSSMQLAATCDVRRAVELWTALRRGSSYNVPNLVAVCAAGARTSPLSVTASACTPSLALLGTKAIRTLSFRGKVGNRCASEPFPIRTARPP